MKENTFHLVKPRPTSLPACRAIDRSHSLARLIHFLQGFVSPDIFHLIPHFSLKASSLQNGTAVTDSVPPVTAGLHTPPNTQT